MVLLAVASADLDFSSSDQESGIERPDGSVDEATNVAFWAWRVDRVDSRAAFLVERAWRRGLGCDAGSFEALFSWLVGSTTSV